MSASQLSSNLFTSAPSQPSARIPLGSMCRGWSLVVLISGFFALLVTACAPPEEVPSPKPRRGYCENHLECPAGMSCVENVCQQLACGGLCTPSQVCQINECVEAEGLRCRENPSICPSGFLCTPSGICQRSCLVPDDCPSDDFPFCKPDAGGDNISVCAQCTFDSDCEDESPHCNSAGRCVECVEDDHCREDESVKGLVCEVTEQICVLGCFNADDCGQGQQCEGATEESLGRCVECEPGTETLDCATRHPLLRCEPQSRLCVECLNNADCSGKGQCDLTTHSCVECTTNDGCEPGNICDQSSFSCIPGCLGGKGGPNCPGSWVCDPSQGSLGTCVDCLQDGDCSRTLVCHNKSCVKGCQSSPSQCDAEDGMLHSDIYCDTMRGEFGECVDCLNDSHCGEGQVCDEEHRRCRCKKTGEGCSHQSECGFRSFDSDNGPVDCTASHALCVAKLKCGTGPEKAVTPICTFRATGHSGDQANCPSGYVGQNGIDISGQDWGRQCVPDTSEYRCH